MTIHQQFKSMGFIVMCLLFFVQAYAVTDDSKQDPTSSSHRITDLPGLGRVTHAQWAGYVPIQKVGDSPSSRDKKVGRLFYWYVKSHSNSAHAPLVLWLNGGPGASSLYGFFMENGPYEVHANGTLSKRRFSWTTQADYLVIDQPSGVGLSEGGAAMFRNEAEAMDELYQALKALYQRFPHWRSKPLYLAGESYAGKYLPQLAKRILNDKHSPGIHLKGLMIGDGWVNPRIQQAANSDYAYYHGLIDAKVREKVNALYQQCSQEILKETPSSRQANRRCEQMQNMIQKQSGGLNLANIATGTEPSDAAMIRYLNRSDVRHALHIDPHQKPFKTFDLDVAKRLEKGEQDSVDGIVAELLDAGIPIVFYNGLDDGKDSNFLSTELWLSALSWSHKQEFSKAPTRVWRVSGQVAGYVKSAGGLTQVKIRGAGHLAPIDQPERVLDLLKRLIANKMMEHGGFPPSSRMI